MKLVDALKIGDNCGLTDVGEAIYNIRIHAGNLFTYGEEAIEYGELIHEFKLAEITHEMSLDTSIKDALVELEV
jgi:hypothetical protein